MHLQGVFCWLAGQSKLANILFAKELAKREEGSNIKAFSLHPGTTSGCAMALIRTFLTCA